MDVNLNNAECIKPISNIGGTIYRNICNGNDVYVPWGMGDWVIAIVMVALVVSIILSLIKITLDY